MAKRFGVATSTLYRHLPGGGQRAGGLSAGRRFPPERREPMCGRTFSLQRRIARMPATKRDADRLSGLGRIDAFHPPKAPAALPRAGAPPTVAHFAAALKGPPMTDAPAAPTPTLTLTPSRQFPAWLADQGASLAFSTYQAGKLFLVGTDANGKATFFERTLERPMGIHAARGELWVATLWQLWRFGDTLDRGARYQDHDALFVPRASHVTGDLDAHDVGVDAGGRPIFVNTLFSCLATVAEDASFTPIWTPPFITRLAAEDRCHLNGLAMRGGAPAFVTATAATDIAEGWREHRAAGGVVVDVASNEIVAQGLSMPHSPRWHDGALWLLQAGTGEFGRIDLATGKFEALCFVPGFARGLAFLGDHAIVGLSLPRENRTFTGLPLQERLDAAKIGPRCGLAVID
ncbi:MAG: hypothetical protein ACI87T_002258, partial [Planctomycetota bacterium]